MTPSRKSKVAKLLFGRELLTLRQKRGCVAGIVVVYILIFPISYPQVGHFYFTFGLLPIVAAGVFLGFWPAIYTVLVVSVSQFGVMVFGLETPVQKAFVESIPIITLLIGGTIGHLRDVQVKLARQREELGAKNERLDNFASFISHDLRNPLTVAQGRINLAQQDCDSDHLENAAGAVDRSLTMIEDLLTLARQGETVAEVETVDLNDFVETCWEIVDDEEATLNSGTWPSIKADRSRLRQLFENLFRNAVEHSETEVTVTVGELADGFFVEDNGPGIPDEDQKRVFETGYSTAGQGTGYGLAIVKEIAHAHGWSIAVTESSAGGARFEITGVESAAE